MNAKNLKTIGQMLLIAMVCGVVSSIGAIAGVNGPNMVPNLVTVRNLVATGQAKFQVVDKQVFSEKTVIELVLVDGEGKSIGGYAPPYLASQNEARDLWKDFVSNNLSLPAMADQMQFTEERKAENESFAVGFVLDHSPSMTMPRAIRMQKAVQHALKTFDPLDYASVIKFTGKIQNEVPISKDKNEYLSNFKVNGINLRSSGTAVYDAAMQGIGELARIEEVSRRIMILFTDGEDNASKSTLAEVINAAEFNKVKVFGVTFGLANDAPIEALAQATSGKVYRLHDIYDFDKVFLGIYNALRHTYTVSVTMKRDFVDESIQQATMTAVGSSMASAGIPQLMAMLPKENVDFAATGSENNIVMNVGLSFSNENADVSALDVPLLDSVATMLIQRSDIALEITANSELMGEVPDENSNVAQKRAQSVRDMLIRRGVPPSRVQSYAGKGAPTIPLPKIDQKKTTFVFTKL